MKNGMSNTSNTNSQGTSLLSTYLDYHHLTILPRKGCERATSDGMPFMPMLLMDAMNMLYDEYIAPLPLRHREKQLRTRWHEAYKHYISQEFMAFNDDQKCEICDKMNEFEDAIHNEVELFRVTVMSKFMKYDTDVRLAISAILGCNILAQSAEYLWIAMRGRKKANVYITSVVDWSQKLLNEYGNNRIERNAEPIDLNTYQDLSIATNKVCKSVISYAQKLCL
jgi:hypothetical protein